MKKYLFIILFFGVWSCEYDKPQPYIELSSMSYAVDVFTLSYAFNRTSTPR
jgi:hypothetical protein